MSTVMRRSVDIIRQRLLQSSASLLAGDGGEADALGLALRGFFPGLKQAFIVNCVPEQGEDIYWILVSPTEIAEIEIPRGAYAGNNPPLLKTIPLDAYQKRRHSRDIRQKLEIGVELIKRAS